MERKTVAIIDLLLSKLKLYTQAKIVIPISPVSQIMQKNFEGFFSKD